MTSAERTRAYVARLDRARATLAEEIEPDIAPVRGLSLDERGDWVARACASAWAILRSRPDAAALLARREQPAPDLEEKWKSLSARLRACRSSSSQ
jgi:hypothetical protein